MKYFNLGSMQYKLLFFIAIVEPSPLNFNKNETKKWKNHKQRNKKQKLIQRFCCMQFILNSCIYNCNNGHNSKTKTERKIKTKNHMFISV